MVSASASEPVDREFSPGLCSYSVFAIICSEFARQACGKLAASSFHGDFEAFVNLLQACTLVMTNLWKACCKLKLLSGKAIHPNVEYLTYLELYSRRKELVNISWRHPPAHSWYRIEGPGAAIRFNEDRKDQIDLARLSPYHLKTLRFSRGDKKFNICTKCNMIEATPQHLLDCVALVYDGLIKRPDFVLEVMKANDLMDLI
ncbi:hypothetical protein AVEN_80968-1 [Araneus ventricosus]|uniref:Uncharacterized protein n=1 Tax=Araneus ventricosus TaxID=182803 RepID=A0A4Y2WZ37_ARAVE|nr:hypothetical protein AVEN_80968-1 [Araneus ventricosus]